MMQQEFQISKYNAYSVVSWWPGTCSIVPAVRCVVQLFTLLLVLLAHHKTPHGYSVFKRLIRLLYRVSHKSSIVRLIRAREFVDQQFPGHWIGRRVPVEWPERSPDLTPLDFLSLGPLESGGIRKEN
jgi:hypothetical protein